MKTLAKLLGLKPKYRINPVKVGARTRYQIQKSVLGFVWDAVINPLVINPQSPYEYKMFADATKKLAELEKNCA